MTDSQWQNAKRHPREFFRKILGEDPSFIQKMLGSLNEEMIRVLQQHPLIEELTDFLSSVAMQASNLQPSKT